MIEEPKRDGKTWKLHNLSCTDASKFMFDDVEPINLNSKALYDWQEFLEQRRETLIFMIHMSSSNYDESSLHNMWLTA